MNDDFLHAYRKPPRKAFARSLYQKLEAQPARPVAHRRLALAASLLLVITLALSAVRSPQTATLTQIDNRSQLEGLQPLTPENAADLQEVARMGGGILTDLAWAGHVIAVAGARGVWVYPADLSAPPRLLENTTSSLWKTSLALSPDGALLAVAAGSSIQLKDVETGALRAVLDGVHQSAVSALAFSPDGRWLASGSGRAGDETSDNAVYIWDVERSRVAFRDLTHANPVTDLTFSPDSALLASMDSAEVHVFNLNTAIVDHVLSGFRFNPAGGLAFSPGGDTLAAATERTINLWDADTGELLHSAAFDIYNDHAALVSRAEVTSFAYLPDGRLAVGLANRGIEIWDVDSNRAHAMTLNLDDTLPAVTSIVPSSDGDQLALLRENNTVELRDTETLSLAAQRQDGANRMLYLALRGDGEWAATADALGLISLYDLNTGRQTRQWRGDLYYTGDFVAAQHENQVAYLQPDSSIALADVMTGEVQRVLPYSDALLIDQLLFSPDGSLLAATDVTSNHVLLWDLSDTERDTPQIVYESDSQLEGTIAFSVDSRQIGVVTGMNGSLITVIELATRHERIIDSVGNRILAIAFSPDGRTLAAITNGVAVLRIVDLQTDEVIHALSHRGSSILSEVTFSPDGGLMATAAGEDLFLWDASTGTLLTQIPHANPSRLAFSPDSRYLVTGGWDGLVRVWGVPEA